jgi:maltoporin
MHYSSYIQSSDRYSVGNNDNFKVEYLVQQLNYPLEDILRAVQEVGFDSDEVEEYIRDRYNRS